MEKSCRRTGRPESELLSLLFQTSRSSFDEKFLWFSVEKIRREDSHEERWTPSVPRGRSLPSGTATCVHLSGSGSEWELPGSFFLIKTKKMNF